MVYFENAINIQNKYKYRDQIFIYAIKIKK